jgi:predicted secreted protein
VTVVSDLRQRRDVFGADDDAEATDADDAAGLRHHRLRGFVRFGVIAVVVFGLWIALSVRQQPDEIDVELVPSPRAVIDVPEGYEAAAVLAPDLSMAADATGTWVLLAGDQARTSGDGWVIVACRQAGSREVRNAGGIVTATLGADLVIDATDDEGVRVAATRTGDVTTAMALDRRPTWIVTVISRGWNGDATALASTVYETAAVDGCAAAPGVAAAGTDLPVRDERVLGLPILPIGLRIASADETTVAWVGDEAGETIVLTSQRPGTGGDDGDLVEFLRPAGDGEAEVLIGAAPAYRADNLDGSEALIWQRDGVIHTLSLGAAVDADVVVLAATLRTPDDGTWQALVESAA